MDEFENEKISSVSFVCRVCKFEDRLATECRRLDNKIEQATDRLVKLEEVLRLAEDIRS